MMKKNKVKKKEREREREKKACRKPLGDRLRFDINRKMVQIQA